MKKQTKAGFTLVELLVVISIIGMLAGLLLPAVNAAREAGRRATCVSNQSNVALALLNYESARGGFPPLRKEIYNIDTDRSSSTKKYTDATWVGQILGYMEFNQAYEELSKGNGFTENHTLFSLGLPVMKCKSSGKSTRDASISYVVNGGYQNLVIDAGSGNNSKGEPSFMSALEPSDWNSTKNAGDKVEVTIDSNNTFTTYFDPGTKRDAVFFDHLAYKSQVDSCRESVSVDYISSHGGTSYVLLVSENLDAGNWISKSKAASDGKYYARAQGEPYMAFVYPFDPNLTWATDFKTTVTGTLVNVNSNGRGELWEGFNVPWNEADALSAMFINVGKNIENVSTGTDGSSGGSKDMQQNRKARPSANHPGIVVAGFADRSVRPLNENMDKQIFVRICQPYSGALIDPASID